jgi:putative alpha-1,2-mannosidase
MKEDFEKGGVKNLSDQLESDYHAYFAFEMAKALGKDDEAKSLKEAALQYKKLWYSEQKDNQGHVRGFFTPEGKPVDDVEVIDKYTYEGNLWHYRWFVLHDVDGFIELAGGKEKVADDWSIFLKMTFTWP